MEIHPDFFYIELELLRDEKIFPFQLYVFHPVNKTHTLYLPANHPFISERRQLLEFIENKGGKVAIKRTQSKTFLQKVRKKEEEIPGLAVPETHELEKSRKIYQHILDEKVKKEGDYQFKKEFEISVEEDKFSKMIQQAHDEIMTFSVTTSHTVSLATYFAERLLTKDNLTNRIVAVSYFLTKLCEMDSEEILADVVCAAFLHHIGLTQIDLTLSQSPVLKMNLKDERHYRKHPGLSQHLLNKSSVELSKKCVNSLLDHHERYDGTGYPSHKIGTYIETTGLIIGAVSHIFEYSEGRITGHRKPIKSVIHGMKIKSFEAGLEFKFGDKIYETIIHLLEDKETDTDKDINKDNNDIELQKGQAA